MIFIFSNPVVDCPLLVFHLEKAAAMGLDHLSIIVIPRLSYRNGIVPFHWSAALRDIVSGSRNWSPYNLSLIHISS